MIAFKFQITIVVYSSEKHERNGEMILQKRTTTYKRNGESDWITRSLPHPCVLKVDMASTIFLVHKHGIHYLHLSIPADIQPPDEDQSSTAEPEQRDESNPILI
jgi:hypothetical protein